MQSELSSQKYINHFIITMKRHLIVIFAVAVMASCASPSVKPSVAVEEWGETDSKPVFLYTLTNSNGIAVKITNYGGIVVNFSRPTGTERWKTSCSDWAV